MIKLKQGKVVETNLSGFSNYVTSVTVLIDGKKEPALNYNLLTGLVSVGDKVLVNTTAVTLKLGSGGAHFIVANLSKPEFKHDGKGHIMKLHYTPLQHTVLAAEEQDSPYHEALKEAVDLNGLPVIIGGLHSQLLPAVAVIKRLNPNCRLVYIMTDGGSLPLALSKTVNVLKQAGYIDTTITYGQAFGGDLEAVNIYSALAVAKVVAKADVVVVTMGPGVTGTGTLLGHSALEQGQIINAVAALNGCPAAILRLSQQDKRKRHFGVSHHSLTALQLVALAPAVVVVPHLSRYGTPEFEAYLKDQLKQITKKHTVKQLQADDLLDLVKEVAQKTGLKPQTMGRSLKEEPYFFAAAAASAFLVCQESF